jgi:hypothetical protein
MPQSSTTKHRARLAAAIRHGHSEEAIEVIRSQLRAAVVDVEIHKALDGQPPLTTEQADELCQLLRSYVEPDPELRAAVDAGTGQIAAYAAQLREMQSAGDPIDLAKLVNQ